ncbi:MAG: hypothetical protein AAFY69_13665 [Pseudomonadota bacterium]
MPVTRRALAGGLLCTLLVAGCGGDPVERSTKALEAARDDWETARAIMAPQQRVAAYRELIEELREIAERYPETPIGQALAQGREANGLSLQRLDAETERLATRATCYADPTVECLLPFTSPAFNRAGQSAGNSSRDLICTQGLDAANAGLEGKRINKRLYADELVQLAFAAAGCDKPEAVAGAVAAYINAEPLTGAERALKIAQIVNTPDLAAGWQPAIDTLEAALEADDVSNDAKATIALTLVHAYGRQQARDEAVAKYRFVTETLGFQLGSARDIGGRLIAVGALDEGLKLAHASVSQPRLRPFGETSFMMRAMQLLAEDLGLTGNAMNVGSHTAVSDIRKLFSPPERVVADAMLNTLSAVESTLDTLDRSSWRRNGSEYGNANAAYGLIGVLRRKLGDSAGAVAALDKADALYEDGASPKTATTSYRFLVAAADEDLNTMRQLGVAQGGHGSFRVRLYIRAAVADGRIEDAIETMAAASPGDAGGNYYWELVRAMIDHKQLDRLEAVIEAAPGGARDKKRYASISMQAFAAAGKPESVQSLATQYQLMGTAREQEILKELLIQAHAVAGNEDRARTLIAELFETGQAADARTQSYNNQRWRAQGAASKAFEVGLFDYGMSLFREARRRNHQPLTMAIRCCEPSKAQLTQILMAAHDFLPEAEVQTVIGGVVTSLRGDRS